MSTFLTVLSPTPFGFFDSSALFAWDADRVITFILRSLGEDILSVELTKKMIWSQFESATREFNGMIIEYQARSNIASILGMPTGSIDGSNGLSPNNINLTNMYIRQNLEYLARMSEPYAATIGYGGVQDSFSGSIVMTTGVQDYDLYTDLMLGTTQTPIYQLQPTGSVSKLEVYEVFHFAPIQYVFNSNLASNFVAQGLPVESYIPDTRFYVLPVFEDTLRAGMLKASQKIRRSHYSYKIMGRKIRIFPTPTGLLPGINDRVWIRVGFRPQPLPSLATTLIASGTLGNGESPSNTIRDDSIYGASNPANLPYGLIDYDSLNPWARNWVAQYTLALCKELLGLVRGKFTSIPLVGGTDVSLNWSELLTQGREDKEKLMTSLKEKLEGLSYEKISELEATKAENLVKQLSYIPMPPQATIKLY